MNPKVAVLTVAFRDNNWLRAQKGHLKDCGLLQLVAHSKKSWNGDEVDPDDFVSANSVWPNEAEQRNAGLAMLKKSGYEWAIILDTDEWISKRDLLSLEAFLALQTPGIQFVMSGKMRTYWKSVDWWIDPPETHTPVIAIRTSAGFMQNRVVFPALPSATWTDGILEHASYAKTDEEVRRKIRTFGHAKEIRKGWLDEIWARWTPDMVNIHPIGDGRAYAKASPASPPDEFRAYWDKVMGEANRKENEV